MSSNTFRNLTHNFAQISSTINDQGNLVENLEQQVAINSQGIAVTNSSGDNIVGVGFTPTTFTYSIGGNTATVPWGTFATKLQNIKAVSQATNATTLNINNALTVQDGETIDNPTTFLTLTTENHIPQINISGDVGGDGYILQNSLVSGVQWVSPTTPPDILNSDNTWTGQNDFNTYCPSSEIDATTNYQLCNYETVVGLVAGGGSNLLSTDNTWTGQNDFSTYCPTTDVSASTAYQIPNLDTVISTVYSIAPSLIYDNTFSGNNTFLTDIKSSNDTTYTIISQDHIVIHDIPSNSNFSQRNNNGTSIMQMKNDTTNLAGNISIDTVTYPSYSEMKLNAGQITLTPSFGNVSVVGNFHTPTLICDNQMYITAQVHDLAGGTGALNQVLVNDGTGAVNWGDQAQGPQGPQGDPGQQGDPGTPGTVLNFIGVWVAGSYIANTVAISPMNYDTYVSTVVIQNVYVDPSLDVSEWTLYTNRGETGATGPTLPISDASGMNGNFLFSDNSGTVYYNNIEGNPFMYTDGDSIKVTWNNGFFDLTGGAITNANSIANYTTGGTTFLDIFNGDGAPSDPTIWSEEMYMSGQNEIWMNTNNGHNSLLYDSSGKLSSATYAGVVDYQVPLTVPENWSIDATGKANFNEIDFLNTNGSTNKIRTNNNYIESLYGDNAEAFYYSSAGSFQQSGTVRYSAGIIGDSINKWGQVYFDYYNPTNDRDLTQYFGFNGDGVPAMGSYYTDDNSVVPITSNSPLSLVGSDTTAVQISCAESALSVDTPLQTPVLPITDAGSYLPIFIGGEKYYIQLWKDTPP